MREESKVGLSLAVELLRQHEGKVGKPQKWWCWELRNEFRRSLRVVLDAVERDLLDRCLSCGGSQWHEGIDPSKCCKDCCDECSEAPHA